MNKICTKCDKEYPATIKYFSLHKETKDKLQSWCRECCRKLMRIYLKKYRKTVNGHLRHIYGAMKQRCNNPNIHNYNRYGGRGIRLKFTSDEFIDYVINVLKIDPRGLTIDRINNDGHYEKGNIRFITKKENSIKRNA